MTWAIINVTKIMYEPEWPDTPVKLGKYIFKISEINPNPPLEQGKLL